MKSKKPFGLSHFKIMCFIINIYFDLYIKRRSFPLLVLDAIAFQANIMSTSTLFSQSFIIIGLKLWIFLKKDIFGRVRICMFQSVRESGLGSPRVYAYIL